MKQLTLALDWTPNINHIGFFIAQDKGFYKDLGVNLQIINPSEDNYKVTPAKKVELGLADFALCPTESIISYQTKSKPFDMTAIASVLQEDLSAIVVKADSHIQSPKDLDGKIYSSYKARYEDGIVKEMIKNDGGAGELKITYPDKLGIWNALLSGEADSTWIFLNWEGVEAEEFSEQLKYFKMKDYGIPYSYSPVIASSLKNAEENAEAFKLFLKATKKGFLYCKNHEYEAVEILSKHVTESDKKINLKLALEMSLSSFGNQENWGIIENKTISEFVNWIKTKGLEAQDIKVSDIYTNQFLK